MFICLPCMCQARKKSTKIKFLGPETARWGGGLPREVFGGQKLRARPRNFVFLGFREERNPECPGNFAGMSRTPGGVQKVCAKKKKKLRAHSSFPNVCGGWGLKKKKTKFPNYTKVDSFSSSICHRDSQESGQGRKDP